jgi:hypothetical protein
VDKFYEWFKNRMTLRLITVVRNLPIVLMGTDLAERRRIAKVIFEAIDSTNSGEVTYQYIRNFIAECKIG